MYYLEEMKVYFKDWFNHLNIKELNRIIPILDNLYNNKMITPNKIDIFKAFPLCLYQDVKIVMLGYDPYPQKGIATGLLFGNNTNIEDLELSPSLQIIKEACINYEIPHNQIIFDNTLESWTAQGVLLLNSSLTTEVNKVGSHTMLWRTFIKDIIIDLSKYKSGIIYMLFGTQAQTFKPYINSKLNYIFEEKHPAYYARIKEKMPSTIFREVELLSNHLYGTPIKWYNEK